MSGIGSEIAIDVDLKKRVRVLCGAKAVIDAHTEVYRDLHLGGDDAYDLLDGIREDYGVDFAGFEFDRYFPNETEAMYYFWGRRIGLWRNRFRPLTIAHLIAVIERGSWFDPPLGAELSR